MSDKVSSASFVTDNMSQASTRTSGEERLSARDAVLDMLARQTSVSPEKKECTPEEELDVMDSSSVMEGELDVQVELQQLRQDFNDCKEGLIQEREHRQIMSSELKDFFSGFCSDELLESVEDIRSSQQKFQKQLKETRAYMDERVTQVITQVTANVDITQENRALQVKHQYRLDEMKQFFMEQIANLEHEVHKLKDSSPGVPALRKEQQDLRLFTEGLAKEQARIKDDSDTNLKELQTKVEKDSMLVEELLSQTSENIREALKISTQNAKCNKCEDSSRRLAEDETLKQRAEEEEKARKAAEAETERLRQEQEVLASAHRSHRIEQQLLRTSIDEVEARLLSMERLQSINVGRPTGHRADVDDDSQAVTEVESPGRHRLAAWEPSHADPAVAAQADPGPVSKPSSASASAPSSALGSRIPWRGSPQQRPQSPPPTTPSMASASVVPPLGREASRWLADPVAATAPMSMPLMHNRATMPSPMPFPFPVPVHLPAAAERSSSQKAVARPNSLRTGFGGMSANAPVSPTGAGREASTTAHLRGAPQQRVASQQSPSSSQGLLAPYPHGFRGGSVSFPLGPAPQPSNPSVRCESPFLSRRSSQPLS